MPSPTTALQIIIKAMRHINALAVGETPTADETADGVDALNDVIETWNLKSLALYESLPEMFTTIAGQNTYTIGAGGTWNTTRPTGLDSAYVTYLGVDYPLTSWTLQEWMATSIKSQQQLIPDKFVYVNDNPLGKVILWPTPSAAITITLDTPTAITGAVDGSTAFILPPGYARALQYAVAVELQAQYGGADVSAYARSAMAAIKIANRKPAIASFDSALTGGGRFIPARGY